MNKNFHLEHLKNYIDENTPRFNHILGVVEEMESLIYYANLEQIYKDELIKTAYLHDIGYSIKLVRTGYEPLDGAMYCLDQQYGSDIVAAIMFHSGSYESVKRNFPDLLSIYGKYNGLLTERAKLYIDLITYCDLHRSSTGEPVTYEERMKEIEHRYGYNHNLTLTMKSNELFHKATFERVKKFKQLYI